MSATEETESSGSDEEEIYNPEMGDPEEGTSSHVSTSSELLNPHGVRWAEQSEISIDYDQDSHPNFELMWAAGIPLLEQRTPFHYSSLTFPMDDANKWITKTSSALANLHRRALTKSEYCRFWGLILAICLGSEPNRRNYWIEESDTDSKQVYPPYSFGSLFFIHVGIRHFEDILHCLSFGDTDPNDCWSSIRSFLIAIDKRKQSIIIPSHVLVVDELTSSWVNRAPHRQHPSCCARIILDTGSQRSYVTNRLKESLLLESEQVEEMLIKTFGTEKHTKHSCPVVTLSMDTKDGRQLQLQFLTVPLICESLSGQPVVCAAERYPHLSKLELADAFEDGDNLDVDVLIGSDHYWKVVSGRVIQAAHGPTALKTKFGWVLSGPAHGLSNGSHGANLLITHTLRIDAALEHQSDSDLDASLKRLWDLEIMGIKEDESSIYEKFTTSVQHHEGRYEVKLPWKESHPTLPDNLDLSQARLRNLLLRLRKDQCILREYDSVIKNQLSSGIIEVVEKPLDGVIGRTHYLPHHAVIRKDKLTTKLRIVYDASARGTGASLNDCLYSGPNFGQNIMAILLRFRTHKIGIIGDIEKAFLMISIAPKDRDVLRFLWIDSIDKVLPRIITFRFKRVVFGVSASPFLLNATIQHHMKGYEAPL